MCAILQFFHLVVVLLSLSWDVSNSMLPPFFQDLHWSLFWKLNIQGTFSLFIPKVHLFGFIFIPTSREFLNVSSKSFGWSSTLDDFTKMSSTQTSRFWLDWFYPLKPKCHLPKELYPLVFEKWHQHFLARGMTLKQKVPNSEMKDDNASSFSLKGIWYILNKRP